MRLIDADHLNEKMIPNCPIEEGGIPLPDFATHIKILEMYPTVDAVPVVHGRWIHTKIEDSDWGGTFNSWKCSACGYYAGRNPTGTNYCPNCGAKMDGDRKEDGI